MTKWLIEMSINSKYLKQCLEPIGLLLLLFSFGWQCFEEYSTEKRIDSYAYELNEKLMAIWAAEYDEALKSDRYAGETMITVDYDVLNKNVKDWNIIQEELAVISKQRTIAFYIRLALYILGSLLVCITKLPHKKGLNNMNDEIKQDANEHVLSDKKSWLEWLTMPLIFKMVILTFSATFIFLIVWQVITSCSGKVQTIEICIGVPADSLSAETIAMQNATHLRTLAQELSSQNKAIIDKYDLLVRAKETEGNFIRLISAIGALILALLGFLGYRTIVDIETKAADIAKDKAKTAAEQYTKDHLEQTVNVKLKNLVSTSELTGTILSAVKNDLNSTVLQNLDQRIVKLEEQNESNQDGDVAEDPSAFSIPNVEALMETSE